MFSDNGICVSFICQDQFEATVSVMGCVSHTHGASCCAVFASEVAVFFLRGASDGATRISTPFIESILTSVAKVVAEAQSMSKVGVIPIVCLSAALVRDQVAATIKECVCVCVSPNWMF